MNTPVRQSVAAIVIHSARSMLQWRLLLLWLLALLLPTAIVALPITSVLGETFDYAPQAPQWAGQFDGIALAELANVFSGSAGSALGSAVMLGIMVSLLLSPWLTASVFVAVRAHTTPGFTALLVGGLKEYGRFFRLLLWALLPMGIAMAIYAGLSGMADDYADKAVLETDAKHIRWLALAGGGFFLLLAHASVETGRAWLGIDQSRHSAIRAWWRGCRLLLQRPVSVLGIYLLSTVLTALIYLPLLLARAHTPAVGALGLLAAVLLTQFAVAVMAWGRAVRLAGLGALVREQLP
ncbi:MAG: hypothetical protein COW59_04850 [Lysobacterales bacterium CG17_big_fil_post_rev_8_21_14_2_50_64_11]|nr:MAG: hypothetical protein COW59_04850 [Xanthomonadales bacterium CG17_big_fil_post_rev_8_21_14_2_50_64_11]PIX61159.1 MAG: hypothetical protein COZ47_03375 [Xanthomonadales bacterium CG_4_10_14_3_um_filter_64_11]